MQYGRWGGGELAVRRRMRHIPHRDATPKRERRDAAVKVISKTARGGKLQMKRGEKCCAVQCRPGVVKQTYFQQIPSDTHLVKSDSGAVKYILPVEQILIKY